MKNRYFNEFDDSIMEYFTSVLESKGGIGRIELTLDKINVDGFLKDKAEELKEKVEKQWDKEVNRFYNSYSKPPRVYERNGMLSYALDTKISDVNIGQNEATITVKFNFNYNFIGDHRSSFHALNFMLDGYHGNPSVFKSSEAPQKLSPSPHESIKNYIYNLDI